MIAPLLPDDLYREIVQHVSSHHDLYMLSLTCRLLRTEAEYFLYRHVESSQWPRTEDLCQLLINCTRLHPLVRSLSITNEGLKLVPSSEYWDFISRLLELLPNLHALKIYNGLSMANNNAWVLDHCIAPLRRLEVDFEFDPHFMEFLKGQPTLEQVHWIDSSRHDITNDLVHSLHSLSLSTPPSDFLPAVTELMTNNSQFALQLVNSGSITHLWVRGHPPHEDDGGMRYISQFNGKAASLRSLRLNFPRRRGSCVAMLKELSKNAPRLRSIGFIPYFDANATDMLEVLSSFKELHSVVTWSVISADTSRLLAQACPSLRLVACLHYSYSHEYVFLPVNPLGAPKPVHDPEFLLWRDA
ncbi:hypothetical protein EIP91_005409 [Steccherinum ochraceum]|uniref:F-box domain-containing protein n=1 Tax=Steccherinum ochraceum TaxID=92696 RepID=A0A4R0RI48_9APHY|nr:hypothetical protein EIP91_005409 [Steccherinum ochraceum]